MSNAVVVDAVGFKKPRKIRALPGLVTAGRIFREFETFLKLKMMNVLFFATAAGTTGLGRSEVPVVRGRHIVESRVTTSHDQKPLFLRWKRTPKSQEKKTHRKITS